MDLIAKLTEGKPELKAEKQSTTEDSKKLTFAKATPPAEQPADLPLMGKNYAADHFGLPQTTIHISV
jgi:hypothetical protein